MRAFLGLGSNLGDRRAHLRRAIDSLGRITTVVAVSDVYETDPVGGPDQDRYLNLVIELDTDYSARDLLQFAHGLEADAQRERKERWGPRTLDVDILWTDGDPISEPDLEVPHPRMWERRFVMAPLAEIAPELAPEGWEDGAVGEVDRLGPLS